MRAAFFLTAWLSCPLLLSAAEEAARPFGYGSLPRGAWACLGSPRFVGGNPARSVAFSPDGKLLATGTSEYHATHGQDIHLWELASGRELHTLRGHRAQVIAVRFTPDSKRLISTTWGHTIRVWDLEKGTEERQFKGHDRVITGLELTPDGKQVVSSSQDKTIRVWDFASGKELRRMKCSAAAAWEDISLSPDGKTLAAAAWDVLLWDIQTGKRLRQLGNAEAPGVRKVRFSPDGKMLAVLGGAHDVSLWDVSRATEVLRLKGFQRGVDSMTFSPDGKILATGGGGYEEPIQHGKNFLSELKLWDVASGKMLHSCVGHTFYAEDVAFSPDGRTLASAGGDFSTRLWDVKSGRELSRFTGHSHKVTSLAYSPDGGTLFSSSTDGTVRVWDALRAKELAILNGHTKAVMAISLTPDGKTLASGGLDGTVRLWDTVAHREIRTLAAKHGEVWCLAFSPDGARLASGDRGYAGSGGTLRLWDWRDGKELWRPADQGGAHCLAFAPDGKTLAIGHHPHIYVREVDTGKLLQQFGAHGEFVRALGYLPDGKLVSAGDADVVSSVMSLWDVSANHRLHQFGRVNYCFKTTMAVSPDGRLLAWACETTIQLFETSTRQKIGEFRGQRGHISVLAFNPDGRTLASDAADGAILFWDLTGCRRDGRFIGEAVKKDDLPALWEKLANVETGRRAMWQLVFAPEQAVPFLQQRLPIVPKTDSAPVRRLLADLDSDDFATRENATRELEKLGDAGVAALQRTLKEKPTPEVAMRVRRILEVIKNPHRERTERLSLTGLQTLRGIEVLERVGTAEAKEVLRRIAGGEVSASPTREAQAALKRLARLGR
jgi:WD40 repeat protein